MPAATPAISGQVYPEALWPEVARTPDAAVTGHGLTALWDGARTGSLSGPRKVQSGSVCRSSNARSGSVPAGFTDPVSP